MATKRDKELAYEAGRAIMGEPLERRTPDACPFSPIDHPEEREAWFDGFEAATHEHEDPAETRRKIKAARAGGKPNA